jgi:coenzyme F420-reducing hydrogenase beta subunit
MGGKEAEAKMTPKSLCTGCGACAAACKEKAITMKRDGEGFAYPAITPALCTHCGLCDKICPIQKGPASAGENVFFGARAREEGARLCGSSGGIFPLLAARVLQSGGVVFGAALSENGRVQHKSIRRIEELPQITRTKYVQSDLSAVFSELLDLLPAERPVLFCGTPCQCAALRALFGKVEGLLLVSLICFGVPSPGIWERYVRFMEKQYGGPFHSFSFRDKRNRDNGHTAALQIGGREYCCPLSKDPFCSSFFRRINLRPCCSHCRYCTVDRESDITLGDFWGIEQLKPDWEDGLGCSAIICHTPEGMRLWESIRERTEWFSCEEKDLANPRQPRLRQPTALSPLRPLYMRLYRLLPFSCWIRLFGPVKKGR